MHEKQSLRHILFYLVEGFFIINIIFLNVMVFRFLTFSSQSAQSIQRTPITPSPSLVSPLATPSSQTVIPIPSDTPTPIIQYVSIPNSSSTNSQVKEYFIPLGTGSTATNTTDWQNISGAQAYITTTSYPPIKQVVFEVSVSVPTANESINIQLYNVTDQHPVWNSTVTLTSGSSNQFLVSQPITLDSGSKLYQVQMQTQLQYPAYLNQSRVHITLQ